MCATAKKNEREPGRTKVCLSVMFSMLESYIVWCSTLTRYILVYNNKCNNNNIYTYYYIWTMRLGSCFCVLLCTVYVVVVTYYYSTNIVTLPVVVAVDRHIPFALTYQTWSILATILSLSPTRTTATATQNANTIDIFRDGTVFLTVKWAESLVLKFRGFAFISYNVHVCTVQILQDTHVITYFELQS